jgi:hypothetical protein
MPSETSCLPSYHRPMPDSNEGVPAHSDATSSEEAPRREVSRTAVQIEPQGMSRWLAPAALVIAVVAAALAIWALVGASSSSGTTLTGDPKTRVCTAFGTVSKAVPLQTHTDLGPDPVAQSAVAGNARLALFGGGQYLLNTVDSATPSNLADPVRKFANSLQDIAMHALAGEVNTDAAQSARLAEADATRQQIVELCK